MEPIPLCPHHILATSEEDCAALESEPETLVGVLAESEHMLGRLKAKREALPAGLVLSCPAYPAELETPATERYIAGCKQIFRAKMHPKAAFYYLAGAESFRALRAAVIALTDMTGRTIVAELHVGAENCMEDGTDCLAAVGVLQRIGVTTVVLCAKEQTHLASALERIAPHARLSLGVRIPSGWILNHVPLTNVEVLVPTAEEDASQVLGALAAYAGCKTALRDHDDMILAPDGRDAHFVNAVIDISDEIPCDHRLEESLLEIEDEQAGALKLVVHEEDELYNLETDLYMLSRPVCLCAETPELLEKALRIYHGLALYDGTYEQEAAVIQYFSEKYGMICL